MKKCMFIKEGVIDFVDVDETDLYHEAIKNLDDSNVSSSRIKIDEGLYARCYYHDLVKDDEFKFWSLANASGRGYCPNECIVILIDPACSPIEIFNDDFDETSNYISFNDSLLTVLISEFIVSYKNNGKEQPILLIK